MAEAMHISVSDVEGVAQSILKERSSSMTPVKKKRPIPVPSPAPAAATVVTGRPDPVVRRKKRPIPTVPSAKGPSETDSGV